jgi:hypothetical protein
LTIDSFCEAKSFESFPWRSCISGDKLPRDPVRFVKREVSFDFISLLLDARWSEKSSLPLKCMDVENVTAQY